MVRFAPLLASLVLACALLAGCGRAPDTPDGAARAIADLIGADDLKCANDPIGADDLNGADEQLRTALARWPADWRLRELQGDLDLRRGYGIRAQAAFERAIRGNPLNRRLQVKLVRSLLVQERYREVLALAVPDAGDSTDVIARLRLVRLEAELALGPRDDLVTRDEAEALWRLAATGEASMAEVRDCLEQLAARAAIVEVGRQRAQCRPIDELARSAEPEAPPGVAGNYAWTRDTGGNEYCEPSTIGGGAELPLLEPDGAASQ